MSLRKTLLLLATTVLLAPVLSACGSSFGNLGATVNRSAFTSEEYGVAVSPRVSRNPNPPKGGGRYMVGKPYTVRGQTYTPREQPGYEAQGTASWYGADFHGRRTANGEIFSANAISAAHPTLPLPSYVRVTNLDNGRSIMVRVNDRGPYVHGRVIDLSHRAADLLGYVNRGMTRVHVDYVSPAPLNGDDTRYLLASLNKPTGIERGEDIRVAATGGAGGKRDPHSMADYAQDFINLFSYAEAGSDGVTADGAINDAHAAANAMAGRTPGLDDWAQSVDEDARDIDVTLGSFADAEMVERVALSFALLGAVEETEATTGSRTATRLRLIQLKPGVSRSDVKDMAASLGLPRLDL